MKKRREKKGRGKRGEREREREHAILHIVLFGLRGWLCTPVCLFRTYCGEFTVGPPTFYLVHHPFVTTTKKERKREKEGDDE